MSFPRHLRRAFNFPRLSDIGPDQIEAVRAAIPSVIFAHLLGAVAVGFVSRDAVPLSVLAFWATGMIVAVVATCLDFLLARHKDEPGETGIRRLTICAALLSLPWGVFAAFALGNMSEGAAIVLLGVLGFIMTNGTYVRAPVYPAALMSTFLIHVPMAAKCFYLSGAAYDTFGLLLVGHGLLVCSTVAASARVSVGRSRSRKRVSDLIESLPGAVAMLDRRNKVLMHNEELFDSLQVPAQDRHKAAQDLASYLDENKLSGLANDAARQRFERFFQGLRSREKAHCEVEFENGKALALFGQPARDGAYIVSCKDITETYQATKKLEHRARHDALTGTLNRAAFLEELEFRFRTRRAAEKNFALLALDLDRFKRANDTYGHQAGDAVLVAVASRIREAIREMDILARLGGDEFCVILRGELSREDVDSITRRIKTYVEAPIPVRGVAIEVGVSIGVAMAWRDASSAEELVRNADEALYRAKSSNVVCLFNDGRACPRAKRLSEKAQAEVPSPVRALRNVAPTLASAQRLAPASPLDEA